MILAISAPASQAASGNSDERTAILAAVTALTVAFLSVLTQMVLWVLDKRAQRKHELMQHRRQALVTALEVVDNVFANSPFGGQPPPNPYTWKLQSARAAMNGMIVFCDNPERTVGAFAKTIGLHNPSVGGPPRYGPADLAEFRNIVCEELKLKPPNFADNDIIWISGLPGGA